jgi:hypothetical protein
VSHTEQIETTITITCAECSDTQSYECEPSQKPEDVVENEGWGYADDDLMLKDLLCPECMERASEDDDDE